VNEISLFGNRTARLVALAFVVILMSSAAFGQSLVGRNSNAVGPTPDGFYKGLPHYQDNEPHCDRNPLLPSNIICMANGYGGADDAIGDAWPRILETQDNARTWQSRYASGSAADPATDLGLGFGADPIMVCWAGACGGFFIASNRAEGGGTGGGVYMELMPELNFESGFRHYSKAGGPLTVQLGTGDNFLDKIDAIFMLDTDNPGTVEVSMTVDLGGGLTQEIVREWPKGRLLVVYASINSSQQNVRVYSTYSDDYGFTWSPPKQVANTTGIDTGVAVAAIDDTVFYAYRQFQDDSGDNVDAVYGAISMDRGKTIRKPFVVIDNLCAFDQPTLSAAPTPNPPPFETVASRTNNFVDISTNGSRFVMVLTNRLLGPGGCLSEPFDYPTGSRVLVTTAGANGKSWTPPIEIAPRDESDPNYSSFPADGHSYQFMPAVDCELGICQAIWYDSIRDSIRNINYLEGQGKTDAVNAFVNYPFFADFYYPREDDSGVIQEVLQFRRTADVFTRQFKTSGNSVVFLDPAPVQVSNYQLVAVSPSVVVEGEQNSTGLKQYKGNTASFMGDYICLASKKMRSVIDPGNPTAPPLYEPNYGPDPLNPDLDPSWFACWTDTRNARGQLYTEFLDEAIPFKKTAGGAPAVQRDDTDAGDEPAQQPGARKLSAEGVEDTNPGAGVCLPGDAINVGPGDTLFASQNLNRIKDADVYGALIETPDTAWLLNARKGLGDIQRTYVIAARNEDRVIAGEPRPAPKTYRFRIMNQPVGFDADEARASWLQLPFENFDNQDPLQAPLEFVDEEVEPQSSVTVALFVVSALPINPVTVNVYEVPYIDAPASTETPETFVETLTVNGALEAGNLVFLSDDPELPNVNVEEIHNPFVYPPTTSEGVDYSNPDVWNPDVWNPDVWNPDVWNPDVWNPDVWNPDVWNPDVWNPDVWNPDVWNPDVWNVGVTDSGNLDNPEIPSPDVDGLASVDGLYAKFDVQLTAKNEGNTTTPYTADFAVNSPLVRQLLADGTVKTQIIVWQDVDSNSYQACGADFIVDGNSPGQNRILAVANNEDLLNLQIPDIFNNRFGSVTYYAAPSEEIQHTVRFISDPATIRTIAPELVDPGISYVVTSQAANTGETNLDPGIEQAINDAVPPTIAISDAYLPEPVPLTAEKINGEVGATLPASPPLVTATKEFETPVVTCSKDGVVDYGLGEFVPLGLGPSTLTCSATAENLAVGEIDVAVDVKDEVDPVLGALPNNAVLERTEFGGAPINYALPLATDVIDSDVAVTCGPIMPGGDLAPFNAPGPTETIVACTAADDSGNTDSGTFLVTVQDTTEPDITVPTGVSEDATSSNGANVSFTVSADDVGAIASLGCSPASGDLFPIGGTTVTCSATDDAGNSSVAQFIVTVSDQSSPTIDPSSVPTSPFDVEANSPSGYQHPPGNPPLFEVTATDAVEGTIAATCSPDGTSDFTFGTTPVSCSAFDSAGNQSPSVGFDVDVADTTPPVIVFGESPLVRSTVGTFATIDYLANVTVTDNADDAIVPVCRVDGMDVGNPYDFPIDTTSTVECTASDSGGNESSASFDVTVNFAYTIVIQDLKGNINTGSTAAIDWHYEDPITEEPVDTSSFSPMVSWLGPYPDKNCGGVSNGDGDGFAAEDSGNSSFRYSFSDNSWRLNWQTPLFAGWYRVTISPPGGDAGSFCEELKK